MARGGSKIGTKASPDGKYLIMEAAEIAHRDKVAFQPSPSHFSQPGPTDRHGNANEPSRSVRSGNFKFSKGV